MSCKVTMVTIQSNIQYRTTMITDR